MATYRGATRFNLLPKAVSDAVEALYKRHATTSFMAFFAIWLVLLHRLTGQRDLLVGTPIANRTRSEVEGLIGFFVNTLVLRSDLRDDGNPRFVELLARVRERALGAYAHQDLPFEKLVEELQPERSRSRSPLFQVLFVHENAPNEVLELAQLGVRSLTLEHLDADSGTAKFDLLLQLRQEPRGLWGALEYSTDLFDATTAHRFEESYRYLLETATADPDRRIAELSLLSPAQTQQLLREWGEAVTPTLAEPVHRRFVAQAARTPDAPAVVSETSLSYRELDRRSNRLAHHLRSLGVGADVPVAVALERSEELVEALLAVLKAGGAFLPLDSSYPAQRLTTMLENAAPRLLLTRRALLERLPAHGGRTVLLDEEEAAIAGRPESLPEPALSPKNLAYLIYTSGSTGLPKGVALPHRTLMDLIGWQLAHPAFGGAALPSFDVFLQEVFSTLCSGGALVLISEEERRDPARMVKRMEEQGVERLFLPYVALQQLAEASAEAPPSALVEVITAGEQLQTSHAVARFFSASGALLENQYGPAESHVVSAHTLRGAPASWPSLPPIGRAVASFRLAVLDAGMRPVPPGVAGELSIRGDGLARGYLGRPALTAERFVPDQNGGAGGRAYRTGDLARFLADGTIEFLGRADHQVKIRGFRVEPGEVETVLSRHPAVREAAVVARGDGAGKRLVAYWVPAPDTALKTETLREHLHATLPEYMVPSAWMELVALPLTPSGKVDRRGLPDPEPGAAATADRVAPRTPTEQILAGIWSEVLGLERVGAESSFFDLGGHSLLATRVLSRIREAFSVELALAELFDAPRLADLAAVVERSGPLPSPPPMKRVPRDGPLPLSPAQQRLWLIDRLEPGNVEYNLPAAVRLRGILDRGALARTLAELVRRHESLRTSFAEVDGKPRQAIAQRLRLGLPMVDLVSVPEARRQREALRLAGVEARRPFDLGRAPLVRSLLLALGEEEHLFLLTQHHVVSDGWSISVLIREVGALYNAFSRGEPSPLEELPYQYVDFAVWQRKWLETPLDPRGMSSDSILEAQVSWWREELAGLPAALELPADRPRPALWTGRGATLPLALPAALVSSLETVSRRCGATLFMTLLAALEVLLGRTTGQRDFAVGSPIAGRRRSEVEGLIGFFVNTLVLRCDLSAPREPSFVDLLDRVRRRTLDAWAHQDVPFEKLVEALEPVRDRSRSPLFQVALMLQNVPPESLALGDLRLEVVPSHSGTAKFDVTWVFQPDPQDPAGGRLLGGVEHATDLFDRSTVLRWNAHLKTLLEAIAAHPESRVYELDLLAPAERQQVVVEWNATGRAYPEGQTCLHRLIEAQAERTPDAVASAFAGEELTYRQLDARANQLARHLRCLGVGRYAGPHETRVALFVERSLEMIVGLVGILKAGGAHVPLDPGYPPERLSFMVEDAGVAVLLTQDRLDDRLSAGGLPRLRLDGEWERVARQSETPCPDVATPGSLAYVIYTSGSTGRPKGAMNTHQAIVNRLLWMQETYPLGAQDRVLQKTPFSFDVSVWELFWPLMYGARQVFAKPEGHKDSAYLVETIVAERITTLHFVPSMLAAFLEEDDVERSTAVPAGGLRRVICSGEALSFDLERRFYSRLDAELHNLYGPTEAAVDVTYWPCERRPRRSTVPIGRPVTNTEIRILDRHLRPVPVGVPGELLIGGVQLARGYHRRPGLTAEKFVPDPFGETPNGRLYKTGDLSRTLPEGNVEYLGRLDHQVKIRGLRIELGEIEATLVSHPAIHEAVVLNDASGDRLVAFLVPDEASALPVRRLLRLEEAGALEKRRVYRLPGGVAILHLNPAETDFLYQEVFELRSYLRHGVTLHEGDVVFDVGANIGVFTLFASREIGAAGRIFSFEPIPAIYDLLALNAELWGAPARLFACGLSSTAGSAELTYYPHVSILSGQFADAAEEREAVRAFLRNSDGGARLRRDEPGQDLPEEMLEELLDERFRGERVSCELRTVSEVMRSEEVERIDLLKVDVEKGELEVLAGVAREDWPKIRQVVVEVHDIEDRRARVCDLLERQGFEVALEQDEMMSATGLYNVYARRPEVRGGSPAAPQETWLDAERLVDAVERTAGERLPEYMVPSAIVLRDALPLLPNGKVDRRALAELMPSAAARRGAAEGVAPRNATEEKLVEIWPGDGPGGEQRIPGPSDPPLFCPAAALVPPPAGALEPGVQRAGGDRRRRAARRRRPAPRPRRDRTPPREPACSLRRSRGGTCPALRGASRAGGGRRRPRRPAGAAARRRGRAAGHGPCRRPLRPGPRSAPAHDALAARRRGARLPAQPAPHRLRRLVARRVGARDRRALPGLHRREALPPAGARGAVRRFRRLAEGLVAGRGSRGAVGVLARGARWRRGSRAAHRPAAAGRALGLRSDPSLDAPGKAVRRPGEARPRAWSDPFHDPTGGLSDAAPPLLRSAGRRGGHAGRRTAVGGGRGPDRFLRQHPGAARRLLAVRRRRFRGAVVRGGPGADASDVPRGPCPPGRALRAAGRGAATAAGPLPDTTFPGRLRSPERRRRAGRAAGPDAPAFAERQRRVEVRPHGDPGAGGGRSHRIDRVLERPFRPQHRRAPGRASQDVARSGRGTAGKRRRRARPAAAG